MKTKISLSGFIGILFAGSCYVLLRIFQWENAFALSFFAGLLFGGLLLGFLLVHEKYSAKKYAQAEKIIDDTVLFTVNGNFQLDKDVRNGNIYFCEDKIYFISLDKKPYITEAVFRDDVCAILTADMQILIQKNDGAVYYIKTADAKELDKYLQSWGVRTGKGDLGNS